MKKLWILLCALLISLSLLSVPAQATEEVKASPVAAQTGSNGYAMGTYPDYWTICVANGYGPTAGIINNWNWEGRRFNIHVLNRCTGYSITNRMTIDNVNNTGPCLQLDNPETVWSPARGKNIFVNNPILFINTSTACWHNQPIELYHRIQMYVGWVLGLSYDLSVCNCIMGATNQDITTVPYVTNADSQDLNVIYG
jgi:hypothetical protein